MNKKPKKLNAQLLVSILVPLTLVLVFIKMDMLKLSQMNLVTVLPHQLLHSLMKKDWLEKPLKIKLQLTHLELFMTSKDLSEENSLILLYKKIRNISHMTSLIKTENHMLEPKLEVKRKLMPQKKSPLWFLLKWKKLPKLSLELKLLTLSLLSQLISMMLKDKPPKMLVQFLDLTLSEF